MTAGASIDAIRAPGRLVLNPTGPFLDGTYPYGGTEIGQINACAFITAGGGPRIECEGLGEASDVLEGANRTLVTFELRGWDDDAVENLFSGGYTAGASTKRARWGMPGSRLPGQSAVGRAVALLFVPDNPTVAPGWIAYSGIPTFQTAGEIMFMRSQPLQLPVALECLRDSSGRTIEIGPLEDLPTP